MAVTLELRGGNGKNEQAEGRARGIVGPLGRYPGSKAKISRVLRTLLDALDDDDLSAVVSVYREAMKATRTFFQGPVNTSEGKQPARWVTEPDHKTRLQAANMVAAYMEGLPVQRQIQMRGDFVELGDLLKDMQRSGEAVRLLNGAHSLPSVPERSE